MEDYYEYLDSNGVTTLYKLIKDDTVALIDSYSVTINGITTNLDNHINNTDIHTPITDIENMVDTKISGLVNSAPETLDTLKELSDALDNDPNFATTIANQIGSKANSVHSHVVSDITNFPTIPTKVSDLTNDSGYITGVAWGDITSKPNFSTVATSGSYTDLSNTPTIPTKVSQLENDMGFGTGGDTSDCVHKTGDETIAGFKSFTEVLDRRNDVTISTVATATQLVDTNANRCGWIANRMHWSGNYHVHNRHIAYNENSGKEVYIDIISSNDGSGGLFVSGTATNRNLTDATSATGHTGIATMGWVNNPATSTNVVHRSGNEAISGAKIFLNDIFRKNTSVDRTVTPTGYTNTNIIFADKNDKQIAHIEFVQRPTGVNDVGIFARDKNGNAHGIHINTNNEVIPLMSSSESYSLGSSSYKWSKVYSDDIVHTSGNETINGIKMFTDAIHKKNSALDLQVNPSSDHFNSFLFTDKNNAVMGYLEHIQTTSGVNAMGLYAKDKSNKTHGIQVTSEDNVIPLGNGVVNLGLSGAKWKNVYATTFNGNLNGNANSATYSTTPATTDNSTRIATTAWVRTYVNSVAGSNTVGSSVSAYWSNSSNVTATGQAPSGGYYPACYSEYITKTPVVGTIYSGAQLYTVLNAYAYAKGSTTGSSGSPIYVTNNTAQATFSSPISSTGKYLCTTANTVKFRAYTAQGSSSAVGTSSVVNNSSAKSIFIRVQ